METRFISACHLTKEVVWVIKKFGVCDLTGGNTQMVKLRNFASKVSHIYCLRLLLDDLRTVLTFTCF